MGEKQHAEGIVEKHSLKTGKMAVKVGGLWYGAWMKNKDKTDTAFAQYADVVDGEWWSFNFIVNDRGYNDIVQVLDRKPPQPAAPPASDQAAGTQAQTEANGSAARVDDPRGNSIERQTSLKVAGGIVAGLCYSGKIPIGPVSSPKQMAEQVVFLTTEIARGQLDWIRGA